VSGLTIGDYLLWNWSLNGNHDVLALVSGLTLPPLAIVVLWLLAVTVARLLARTGRDVGTGRRMSRERRLRRRSIRPAQSRSGARSRRAGAAQPVSRSESPPVSSPTPSRPSRKIAA
jgi:hypothetical protein